jgi:glycosyltransferase involved in cell wall biosynthesis
MSSPENLINSLVDVVTPTLNAADFIDYCLLSTKNLRGSIVKHIVVDSGSSDETISIANAHQVQSFYCPPGNMYRAINHGITQTRSKWVTYINGDDILFPGSLLGALESLPQDCDVIYGNIDYVDSEGRFLHHWRSAKPNLFRGLFSNGVMPIPQQGTLFRRSLWEELEGFQEQYKYASDFDFFLRAFLTGARFCYFCREPIAAFRIRPNQFSQTHGRNMELEASRSLFDAHLVSNRYDKMSALAFLRIRNLDSYLVRNLRFAHIARRFRVARTISGYG